MKKFLDESWLVLVMGVVFAGLLAATQAGLAPRIEANQQQAIRAAVFEVVPGAESVEASQVDGFDVYKCTDEGGRHVGWALKAEGAGFQDKITLVVGITPDTAQVTGMKVIKQAETPGLGDEITKDYFRGRFNDTDATTELKVEKKAPVDPRHQVQAITGPTISSEAVVRIVNDVLAKVRPALAHEPVSSSQQPSG